MSSLESWTLGSHTAGGVTHPTYREGSGPGVIVIHEIPGITPAVLEFAEEVVARGFTVVMPSLFGQPEPRPCARDRPEHRKCLRQPGVHHVPWAARHRWPRRCGGPGLRQELGGPGVGAVGMCLTGGYAL